MTSYPRKEAGRFCAKPIRAEHLIVNIIRKKRIEEDEEKWGNLP